MTSSHYDRYRNIVSYSCLLFVWNNSLSTVYVYFHVWRKQFAKRVAFDQLVTTVLLIFFQNT